MERSGAGRRAGPREPYRLRESLSYLFTPGLRLCSRRRGYSRHEAQDLTQDFFVHLLQKNIPDKADPLRGKFRTFLLTALEFFLLHHYEKAGTQKRGGDATMVFLDEESAEERYQLTDPGQLRNRFSMAAGRQL